MDNDSGLLSFVQTHWEWIFGSGGAVGLIFVVLKHLISKPSIQQSQSVQGQGEGYQAGGKLTVTRQDGKK